jgi:transmembrane sensor
MRDDEMSDQRSTDRIASEAADWVARLQSPDVSKGEVALFEEWRDRDDRHAQAFGRCLLTSYLTSKVTSQFVADEIEFVKQSSDARIPARKVRSLYNRHRTFALAASVAFSVSLCLGLLYVAGVRYEPLASIEQGDAVWLVFATSIGENRTIVLADSSRVTLGGQTRMEVALTNRSRTVRLSRGEAYFEVAKDSERKFLVQAGSATITAVGTAFNVLQYSERAVVTVTEGRVLVEPEAHLLGNLWQRGVRLNAGEQSTVGNAGIGDAVVIADLASILSWRSGRLSFRQRPLRDAVLDVNRYTPKPLVLAPSIGDITVTGTVSPSNIGGWIRSLERAFGLKAIEAPDRITLQSATVEQVGR